MDRDYRRCVLCDYFEGGEEKDGRKFIFDKPTQEHHCIRCADAIQEVAGRGYWLDYERDKTYALQQANRALQAGRNFRGYDPTTPLPYATVAPTSADLAAIETEWEDLLKEMDLGTLEEVD